MRRLRKIVKIALWTVLGVLVLDSALVLGMGEYQHPEKIPKTDAIIALGAAINSRVAYNRALTGLSLYRQGKAGKLVFSGGRISDADITEAAYMQKVAEKEAGQKLPTVLEEGSHSTYENLKNTRAKIGATKSVVIVTDKYHVARSVILAKRQGFGQVYWASPQNPAVNRGELRYHYLREILAMLGYIPQFIFG